MSEEMLKKIAEFNALFKLNRIKVGFQIKGVNVLEGDFLEYTTGVRYIVGFSFITGVYLKSCLSGSVENFYNREFDENTFKIVGNIQDNPELLYQYIKHRIKTKKG